MAALDPGEVKLFRYADQLPDELWKDLETRDPLEAAASCDAFLEGKLFRLSLFSRDYVINPARRSVTESLRPDHRVSYQTGLVLITTLAKAQNIPHSGRMITPGELPGGRLFFTGPHELPTKPIIERFGSDVKGFITAAGALGGRQIEESADAAVFLPGLPRVPMWLLLWEADEEFEARAVMGIDERAHYHLALDAVWAMCNVLTGRLVTV
ncbi:MAG: DUF3786 domain-containing protein [Pseudomonadota bacterium]